MKLNKWGSKFLLAPKLDRRLRRILRKGFTLSIAAGVILLLALASCTQAPKPPLRVGFVVWPGSESMYLARDLGYYKNTPIKMLDYPSDAELMRSYRNGELEAITITLDECLTLAETAPDVRIVTIQDVSNGGDAIIGRPAIKKLQDLKGKRFGVESPALGAFEISRALEQAGMTTQDVKIVSLLVSDDERAFKDGSVDAVVTYEPTVSKLRAIGGNLLWSSKQIPGEVLDVVAMRESAITQQPEAANALTTGWFRALDYLQKHPQDAARRMAAHEGLTPEAFLKSLSGVRIPDVEENQKILGKTDVAALTALKRLPNFLLEKGLLKKTVDLTSVFDARLVQDVEVATFKNKA